MIDLISRINELRKRQPDNRTIVDDLVGLYQEIIKRGDAIEAEQPENFSTLLRHDETLRTLKSKFKTIEENATKQQKRQVVDALTGMKLMPEYVGKIIDLYNGEIISMVTER
jgi:hypothetical protein